MNEFTVRTPDQLSVMLRGFRKKSGLTQAEVAARLGVRQQALSALERNAKSVSTERLMRLLSVLSVDLVLREHPDSHDSAAPVPNQPQW